MGTFTFLFEFKTLSYFSRKMKMNRLEEAKRVMEEALPYGNVTDLHYYGRTLVNRKQAEEAFKVFKLNYDKYPNLLPPT